jgi:transcriptional regulator with XRE-family HTH domain
MSQQNNATAETSIVGKTLRDLLEKRLLSQDHAARLAGVRLGFLSRLVRGKRTLEPQLARSLAAKWGLDKEDTTTLVQAATSEFRVGGKKTAAESKDIAKIKLGDFIREKRLQCGLTAKNAAELVDMKYPNWTRVEKGRDFPNPAMAASIAKKLRLQDDERVALFCLLAKVLEGHPSYKRALTAPALIALAELAMCNHLPPITEVTDVIIFPKADVLPLDYLSQLADQLRNQADKLSSAGSEQPQLTGALIRHGGHQTLVLSIFVDLKTDALEEGGKEA